MRLGDNYCIIHQSIILDGKEVNDYFEEFLKYIMSEIKLKTISKEMVKCIGPHFISAKNARKINHDYADFIKTGEYKITFAFRESEQKKFVEKVNVFWTQKATTIEST